MASKKSKKSEEITPVEAVTEAVLEEIITSVPEQPQTKTVEDSDGIKEVTGPSIESPESTYSKYSIGSIVYIAKDADADLNGFKLFPQYKKYTYTVEAYDAISGVYSLRRLNLSLKLKERDIVAPHERAHDSLNRRQF